VRKKVKINNIKLGMTDISLKATVIDVSEPRSVNTKFGYQTKVATAKIKDDSGEIILTLWGKQIDEVGEGDTVEISGGYVREFKGELQLNVGKGGSINVVE
jgi:replication factor A1